MRPRGIIVIPGHCGAGIAMLAWRTLKESRSVSAIRRRRQAPCVAALLVLLGGLASAADWPTYRGNSARTAKTEEKLHYPLQPVWKYVPGNAYLT